MSKITTKWIADDAIDKTKIAADIAGLGLTQAAGGELDVNVDDASIEIAADTVQIKALGVGTAELAGTSVTAAKLGSDVAGDGLTGGNGSNLDVDPDATGGANLAKVINVSANGVAVKVDDATVEENGSAQLGVKANGIGAAQLDETDNYTFTGTMDMSGATSVSVPTPTSDAHAATKAYADGLRAGVSIKDPVRAMADSNQTLSGLPSNIDGVTGWAANDRILLQNQTTASENGPWETQSGAWTRPSDFGTGDSASGAQTWVDQGTNYGESQWTCTTDDPNDVIDTNNLAFTQTSGAGQITAGVGLTKSGNTVNAGDGSTGNRGGLNFTADDIAAATDGTTLEVAANVIQIKALGVGTAELAGTSVTATKLGSDVAGDGLTGGNGSNLDVDPDATGGANLGTVVNVSANGVAVKIDDASIGENISNQLEVKANGVTETELNASVAGDGIGGGGGSALALDINGIATAEVTANNADLIAIYDDSATGLRKMTRGNFLSGTSGESGELEMHLITAGETTAGFFTLATTPISATSVRATPQGGPEQVNKQVVGATGATPDFDVLSSTQLHFNNNGAGVGLSGDMTTGDIIIVRYES